MQRIAREGRKYGVGLAVVSQRPNELSETVLAQCNTFICLRLTNPDDQAYIRSLVPEAERDLIEVLSSLGRGEALAMGQAQCPPACNSTNRVRCQTAPMLIFTLSGLRA
jgi:DNA helicase HerA-like ATPase